MEEYLQNKKEREDAALKQAQADAIRKNFLITFEGQGPSLVLKTVSVTARQRIKFNSEFADDDRLTDLLALLRSKLGLKNNEDVAITGIKTVINGILHRRPLKCMEWNEEEDAGLGMGDKGAEDDGEEVEEEEMWGLNPNLMLRDIKLFRNNVTVVFIVNEQLQFKFPPDTSEPSKMPKGPLVKQLRERLIMRRHHFKTLERENQKIESV